MPTKPNPPADAAKMRTLTSPDYTPEEQMTTNENLDTTGIEEIRVDCNCSRYSRETVSVPHGVIMDTLVDPVPVSQMMTDERITATKIASLEPRPPSADFKQVHLAQVAASMRIKRLIPFSPFVANFEALRARESFTSWREKYYDQLPPDSRLSESSDEEPVTKRTVSNEPEPTPEPTPEPEPEPTPEPAPFQTMNVAQLRKWIGSDPERATEAMAHELTRTPVRSSVIAHSEKVLGGP